MNAHASPMVVGKAVAYRLYDVGYSISLPRALDLLAASAPDRVRPIRGEAAALQIQNPPIGVVLGSERIVIDGQALDAEVAARVFDFGVVSLRLKIEAPALLSWDAFSALGRAVDAHPEIPRVLDHHVRLLCQRIRAAIERESVASVREDYVVFRLHEVRDEAGAPSTQPALLQRLDVAPLLLGETRPLSEAARRELLTHQFSYYEDDLAILTWDNALIVDSASGPTDVEYILEFANAQLLELRYYDAVLDAELQKVSSRIEAARGKRSLLFTRRYSALLGEMQRLYTDSTELVERVENALKVTDDVYLARVYSAALDIFRGRAWRADVDRKLALLRDTYEMLNGLAQARRGEALETAIVVLIVAEILLGFLPG
ncbi:MAG: hypothetical protein ACT4P7_07305 [Gemmatimonadaceae bacterium]